METRKSQVPQGGGCTKCWWAISPCAAVCVGVSTTCINSSKLRARRQTSKNLPAGTLTEEACTNASSGAFRRVFHVVIDDHDRSDHVAEIWFRPDLALGGEVVPEVQLAEDACVVAVDPLPGVVLENVLSRGDDLEVEVPAVFQEDVSRALHERQPIRKVSTFKESSHLVVRLRPSSPPDLVKVVALEVLRRQFRTVLVVVEGAELQNELSEHLVDVHRDYFLPPAGAGAVVVVVGLFVIVDDVVVAADAATAGICDLKGGHALVSPADILIA